MKLESKKYLYDIRRAAGLQSMPSWSKEMRTDHCGLLRR